MSPEGQKLEGRIRELWSRRKEAHARLDPDVQSVARELADTPLGFRDWETLYRELLQVVVASHGASRVIQAALARENASAGTRRFRGSARALRSRGGAGFRKAAANNSLKVIEKMADRMLRILARR
jgi:hypothetical protein